MKNSFRFPIVSLVTLSIGLLSVLGSSSQAASPNFTWIDNGAISFSQGTYLIAQNGGSVLLRAQRNGGNHGVYVVNYKTVDQSAVAGQQYTAETGKLTWGDGDSADKLLTIPITSLKTYTGDKSFYVRLTESSTAMLGAHNSSTVTIVQPTAAPPAIAKKSIRQWATCNQIADETDEVEQAIKAAANNTFILVVDCTIRFHIADLQRSIEVPDGVTISFTDAGEFDVLGGTPALKVPHPAAVTFLDWNVTIL